jgi:hypothetical protein
LLFCAQIRGLLKLGRGCGNPLRNGPKIGRKWAAEIANQISLKYTHRGVDTPLSHKANPVLTNNHPATNPARIRVQGGTWVPAACENIHGWPLARAPVY